MAGTVDTSSYNNLVKPNDPVNPLQMLGTAATLQGTLNQNRLFQQEYNSKLGLSQIYKQAIDPATGQLDTQKLNQLMSDPNASANVSLGLPQAYQNSQEAQKRNIDIGSAQLNLAKQHLDTLETYVTPLVSQVDPQTGQIKTDPKTNKPVISSNDIVASLSQAMNLGHVDPNTAAQLYKSIPRVDPNNPQSPIDETQVGPWLLQQRFRMLSTKEQLDAQSPVPSQVNTGGQTHLIRTPQVGAPSEAGVIANTLPPTTGSVATVNGQPNTPVALGPTTSALQVPGQGAPPPPAPTQPGPLAGSMPGVPAPPVSPTPAAPAGPVQTGLAPGIADAAQVAGHASAEQGVSLQQAADQIPQQKAILQNLGTALDNFTAGPGADWRKVASAFANTPLQALGLKGVGTASIASQEEFDKLATNLAQSQFATLGGTGTDAKLDSAMHTSPNSALSKLGNKNIMALLKGNADAIAIKNQEWQKYQQANGPQSYGAFSTGFNKSYNPRVFQSVYMAPQDRTAMIKDMTKPELNQFRSDYNLAVHNGWIPDPRQPNAGQ